jgi:hypothetical protein
MYSLKSYQKQVENLSPAKLWMFIFARGFLGFGIGAMAMQYFPRFFTDSGLPMFVIGLILFGLAVKGSKQKARPSN